MKNLFFILITAGFASCITHTEDYSTIVIKSQDTISSVDSSIMLYQQESIPSTHR